VLEAAETMNRAGSSGVAVVNKDGKVVGLVTERRLLREFFALNKKPEEVNVSQVMGPFYRISPNASTKKAPGRYWNTTLQGLASSRTKSSLAGFRSQT
jgi:CBS domain-containing protein